MRLTSIHTVDGKSEVTVDIQGDRSRSDLWRF